jgi:hypothetical protein
MRHHAAPTVRVTFSPPVEVRPDKRAQLDCAAIAKVASMGPINPDEASLAASDGNTPCQAATGGKSPSSPGRQALTPPITSCVLVPLENPMHLYDHRDSAGRSDNTPCQAATAGKSRSSRGRRSPALKSCPAARPAGSHAPKPAILPHPPLTERVTVSHIAKRDAHETPHRLDHLGAAASRALSRATKPICSCSP